jgi:hypothetical protein
LARGYSRAEDTRPVILGREIDREVKREATAQALSGAEPSWTAPKCRVLNLSQTYGTGRTG